MKKINSGSQEGKAEASPSQLIDARIEELNDWRGETLARIRKLIHEADPDVVEELKMEKAVQLDVRGSGVVARRNHLHWGDVQVATATRCGENAVKMTFAKGASLPDPAGLFNSRLPRRPTPGVPSTSMRATRLMNRR